MRAARLPLLFVVALLASACSTATNDEALSLVGETTTGGQIDFNSLEGTDTVLWFWAPW